MESFVVRLSSELGTEDFDYTNLASANEGFDRLKKSCKKHFKKDKIVRTLCLIVRDETIGRS